MPTSSRGWCVYFAVWMLEELLLSLLFVRFSYSSSILHLRKSASQQLQHQWFAGETETSERVGGDDNDPFLLRPIRRLIGICYIPLFLPLNTTRRNRRHLHHQPPFDSRHFYATTIES
ncbi:hypothetical protein EX30DRAFT_263576 [Ascodesmis nigricans]|uniref:Uncharacterized protein n=1 Tax=Ascodesmis nigricans TaxID=341454 RepID=A0A4V3SIT8_9PEZI|nr:hypothetical protein EX30DRAFT_263576 [Ascodesmis nigricans]